MVALRGLTVSVGYAPVLRITLPRNMRHQVECVVISSPEDEETRAVVESVPGARLFVTNAFTRPGSNGVVPRMNKGLAIEEAFSYMGRYGWLLIHDADILLPGSLPLERLRPDALHGARRRILEDPSQWTPDLDWGSCAPHRDGNSPIGFLQLFHADAPALKTQKMWYDVTFPHCGGGDAFFLSHWGAHQKVILPMEVLHLGRPDMNWMGTDQEGRDLMAKYVTVNGWNRAMNNFDPAAAERAGDLPGRLVVPGYPESNFMLPFEKRTLEQRANRGQ